MDHKALIKLLAALLCCLLFLSACRAKTPEETLTEAETAPVSVTKETATEETESTETETAITDEAPAVTEKTATPAVTEKAAPKVTEKKPAVTADQTPPIFLTFTSPVKLERGKAFDLHKYISYIDDLDREVDLTVEGSVDTNTAGSYSLTLTIKDDAENSATRTMTVQITEPAPPSNTTPTTPATPAEHRSFAAFSETYKRSDTMVGIDVSKWQGEVDFNKAAQAGCEFVIIRLGGYADGETFEDKFYQENIRNAKSAGLKVGVYWYSEENGKETVKKNAQYLYSLLNGEALDFPIFFDWEDYRNMEDYKMSIRDLNETFLAFREEAESRGYGAALYNSKYYLGVLWSEEVKGDGVWLAHYVDSTNYEGKFFLWQQGVARIDGINGDVDVNVLYPGKLNLI